MQSTCSRCDSSARPTNHIERTCWLATDWPAASGMYHQLCMYDLSSLFMTQSVCWCPYHCCCHHCCTLLVALPVHLVGGTKDSCSELRVGNDRLKVSPIDCVDQYAHVAGRMLCQISNSRSSWLIATSHQGLEHLVELSGKPLCCHLGPVVGSMCWGSNCSSRITVMFSGVRVQRASE